MPDLQAYDYWHARAEQTERGRDDYKERYEFQYERAEGYYRDLIVAREKTEFWHRRNNELVDKVRAAQADLAAAREDIAKAVEFAVVDLLDGTENYPDGVPTDGVHIIRDAILARYQLAGEGGE
jgi:hypothetical protein